MTSKLSREKAAQAWCKPETSMKQMDSVLCEAFAEILDEIWSKPWLGNATTAEMLTELQARAEVAGYANYRSVDEAERLPAVIGK